MANNFFKISKGMTLAPQSSVSSSQDGDIYYDSVRATYVFRNNGFNTDLQKRTDIASASSMTSTNFTASAVESSLIRVTGSTLASVHGMTASADGKTTVLYNQTSQPMIVKSQSATESTASNRIVTYNGSDMTLLSGQAVMLGYDSSQSRWVVLSTPGSSSTSTSINYITNSGAETDTSGWSASTNNETVTITIASPAVITITTPPLTENFYVGQAVSFSTTGALPTGITAGTTYYISAVTGLGTYNISATLGGANVNTSGTQSGTHTLRAQQPGKTFGSVTQSPNITLTRTTSSPLRGNGSFLITKDAANRQGEEIYTTFTIDRADQSKMLAISFDYEIASGTYSGGTDSTDSDLEVYITDVTNNVLIQPSGYKLTGSVSGIQYKYTALFQTVSNSTSYALRIHIPTTSASAFTFKLDNVIVGPQIVQQGPPITSETSYTPTLSAAFGTTSNINFKYVRNGDKLIVRGTFTAGTTAASLGTISLPTGLSIDTTKIGLSNTTSNPGVGIGEYVNAAAQQRGEIVTATGTSTTVVYFGTASGASGSFLTPTNVSAGVTGGNVIAVNFIVPIAGWDSTVQMSNDTDTRVCAARYKTSSTQSISNNTETILNFDTSEYDTHGVVTTGASWKFTAPIPGYYSVAAFTVYAANATGERRLNLQKNGSVVQRMAYATGNGAVAVELWGSADIQLNAGDTISVSTFQNSGTSLTLNGDNTMNWVAVRRLSGPSQIAVTETIAASANTTTQATSNGVTATVICTSKLTDTHGAYNTSTGEFTCPVAGFLDVAGSVTYNGTNSGVTAGIIYIYKNGVEVNRSNQMGPAAVIPYGPTITMFGLKVVAGDVITVRFNPTGFSPSLLSGHIHFAYRK